MKKLFTLLLPCLCLLLSTASALANDARATEILKQAREAIGGEERLQKLEALHINGQYRRAFGERQMAGEREISIALPNKYLVEDSMNPGGMSTAMINYRALNGERAWSGSSGGGGMVFRMSGPGGQQLSPEQMEASLRRIFQAEFTRYLLVMTLAPPAALAVEYKYAGESDVEGEQADVIDVTGADNFYVRLFFDKKNHLPLLLSYRGPKPRIMTMSRAAGGPARSPEDIKKAREEADKKLASEQPAGPREEVDFYIRLSDHKKVDGLMLPFKLTFLTESEVSEEFEISKYQVNPQFKADKFEKH
ncbi:MAG TPA: hypothetical protein VM941_06400 [Pyrinomonadaceae bacterium]|jgi:hypothetical protein|nr:hypothetical protein [Pyrinomonadaceae bacterium]